MDKPVKKQDVGWVADAPQRCCGSCKHYVMDEPKPYAFKPTCGKYGFRTKVRAICATYEPRKA